MNKGDLIAAVTEDTGIAKGVVEKTLSSILDTIKLALAKDEDVQLIGFGSFVQVERKARQGFNPKTGEKMEIAASKSVKFKPGAALKGSVNK